MDRGWWTATHVRGVPVRLHWTIPFGALFFGGLAFVPVFWFGFFATVLLHEFGHAWVVRAVGARTHSVDVYGLGGMCRWSGAVSPLQRSLIAWGGIWAQALLLAVTWTVFTVSPPTSNYASELRRCFVDVNLYIMVLNLVPIPPLDGAEAWPLFGHLWRRFQRKPKARVKLTVVEDAQLDEKQFFEQVAVQGVAAARDFDPAKESRAFFDALGAERRREREALARDPDASLDNDAVPAIESAVPAGGEEDPGLVESPAGAESTAPPDSSGGLP